jgi:hypothetical protein
MKKSIFIFAALILTSLVAISQNTYNLVIFSEDSEPFYAFVNGIRQNDRPETNIRVTGLNSEALNVRVTFENKALPQLKQNMAPEPGFEHTINIRRNRKKEIKMQYFGQVPLNEAPQGSAANIPFHTDEHPLQSTSEVSNSGSMNSNTSITTTQTNTQLNNNPEKVAINVNIGGLGMNMNVDVPNQGTTVHSSSSTTVTSSSSSSSSKTPVKTTGSPASTQSASNAGCSTAMNSSSYEKMKESIASKPFSETKMSTAKVATKNACLTSDQIRGICELFSMDNDKLAYAKYAYNYCIDKNNFYHVSEVFSFSATTDDLNKFLENN